MRFNRHDLLYRLRHTLVFSFFFRRGASGAEFTRSRREWTPNSFCTVIQIKRKLNENENESGGTCEGGAKRHPVGRFPRFVFVFVLIYV